MPRSITTGLQTELDKSITRLAYMVQINASQTLRWNNGGDDIVYNGVPWIQVDFKINGLSFKPDADPVAQIEIQNLDDAVGALFLTEPMADATIDIYQFAPSALADGDAAMLVRMVFDQVTIGIDKMSASLLAYASFASFSPRRRVDKYNGFFNALPAGSQLAWENEVFILQPERSIDG